MDCGLARMWVLEDSGRSRKKSHRTAEGVQCCTLNWLHTCNFDLFAWSREPISLQVSESVRSFDYLSNLSPTILKATITLATTMGTQCAFTLFCMISISLWSLIFDSSCSFYHLCGAMQMVGENIWDCVSLRLWDFLEVRVPTNPCWWHSCLVWCSFRMF